MGRSPLVSETPRNTDDGPALAVVGADGESLLSGGRLVSEEYDYISLSPPAQPTTIVFKSGGSSGTTVATLTLAYSGSDLSSVTRT